MKSKQFFINQNVDKSDFSLSETTQSYVLPDDKYQLVIRKLIDVLSLQNKELRITFATNFDTGDLDDLTEMEIVSDLKKQFQSGKITANQFLDELNNNFGVGALWYVTFHGHDTKSNDYFVFNVYPTLLLMDDTISSFQEVKDLLTKILNEVLL